MRRPLVVGNWKMNGTLAGVGRLLDGVLAGAGEAAGVEIAVCAPFVYLAVVADRLRGSAVGWGAQNVSEHTAGAYTGEVSAGMLAEFGCHYVIVGHSERRTMYGETDAGVAARFVAAQRAGLAPILCVGETLDEREDGETDAVVARQLDAVIGTADILGDCVIAYEPVWAIGTGKTATAPQAQAVHAMIRARLAAADADAAARIRVVYGGSMKPANAAELLAQADIDGGLIGGASLAAGDFLAIAKAASAATAAAAKD